MSENLNNVDTPEAQQDGIEIQMTNPNPIKRAGCGLLLGLWFTLLLTPCALFYLASNGEIRIWNGDNIPESYAHPRLLVELVSEVDYRGLQFTRSFEVDTFDNSVLCLQTDVSYFLWESIEENQNTSYCDCYAKDDTESIWSLSETSADVCMAE